MMAKINQRMGKRLNVICNQFREEQIGDAKLNLMPPIDKIPIISRMHYNRDNDRFEIYFDECDKYIHKLKNGVDFLEDETGRLMAVYILNFSQLDIDNIKLDVFTSIENEIERLSMELSAKKDILNNVIDKRKLMFLDTVVKNDYNDLRKEFVN